MWQLLSVGALVCNAFEGVTDKWAIVHDHRVDTSVATFWRNALFFVFTVLIGIFGWLGEITWYFTWPILVFAMFAVVSSYCYTYVLRKIEVTSIMADTYLLPLIFLGIDYFYLHAALTSAQIVGVILLALGGFAIALDGKTHYLKRGFTLIVFAVIAYWMVYDGFEYYLFKFLNETSGVNSVSFFASAWLIVTPVLLLVVVLRGKYRALFGIDSARYVPAVSLSKFFDTGSALFMVTALMYASASQVAAIGALQPLMLLIVAAVTQKMMGLHIREKLDRANFIWKSCVIALLCLGMYLVS